MKEYYRILGLGMSATKEEIKTAYRKLSKKFHPDVNNGDKFFEDRFKEIQEAYEKLMANEYQKESNDNTEKETVNNKAADTSSRSHDENMKKEEYSDNSKWSNVTSKERISHPNSNDIYSFVKWTLSLILITVTGILIIVSINKSRTTGNLKNVSGHTPIVMPNEPSVEDSAIAIMANPTLDDIDPIITIDSLHTDSVFKAPENIFSELSNENIKKWLYEKLNQYTADLISCPELKYSRLPCTEYFDYEFNLTENYLIVKYNYNNDYEQLAYIPYYDVNSVYGNHYGSDFSISTHSNSMNIVNKFNRRTSNFLMIGFRNNAEPELIENINLALGVLKQRSIKPATESLPIFMSKHSENRPTQEEARTWLLSKLKMYASTKFRMANSQSTSMDVTNLSVSMIENNLIIEFNNYQMSNRITVPLCKALIKQPFKEYGDYSANECTVEFYTPLKVIEHYNSYSGIQYLNSVQLKVELNREDNLFNRLKKALATLREFCPTVGNTNEVF